MTPPRFQAIPAQQRTWHKKQKPSFRGDPTNPKSSGRGLRDRGVRWQYRLWPLGIPSVLTRSRPSAAVQNQAPRSNNVPL